MILNPIEPMIIWLTGDNRMRAKVLNKLCNELYYDQRVYLHQPYSYYKKKFKHFTNNIDLAIAYHSLIVVESLGISVINSSDLSNDINAAKIRQFKDIHIIEINNYASPEEQAYNILEEYFGGAK